MSGKIFFGKVNMNEGLEHGIMADRHKQVIGVVGIGRGAGATFMAMGLALKMAEMTDGVTFAEGRMPCEGERNARRVLDADRHFGKKPLGRVSGPGAMINVYRKVNWAVHGAEESDLRSLTGKHIIVDSPGEIEDVDIVVCVVDPLPSRILAGLETFRCIREQTLVPVIWVLNKDNGGVSRREIEKFLRTEFTYAVPLVPAEIFYRAEYNCTLPYDSPGMEGAGRAFTALAEEILLHNL